MKSGFQLSLLLLSLLSLLSHAAVVQRAPSQCNSRPSFDSACIPRRTEHLTYLRALVNPNDPGCPAGRVSCDDFCCSPGFICSSTFTCVKKPPPPPPPPPGTFSISWFTDRIGSPNIISVHGSGFAAGAAVSLIESWVTHNSNGSPEYHEFHVWSKNFTSGPDFDYSTGYQDCSRLGSPGNGQYGEPAQILVMDWALGEFTYTIPVRTQWGYLCTTNQA